MGVGVLSFDFHDGWVVHVVVVVVGNDDGVDGGDVFDLAGHVGVALRPSPAEGAAALAEDWVEEHAQTAGEFDKVAGVAEPGCAKGGCFS